MNDFEAWEAFRKGESDVSCKLICTECGGKAEGNCSWTDGSGEICDACNAKMIEADRAYWKANPDSRF